MYHHWVTTIDYKSAYNACVSETIIPHYLYHNHNLYSGLLKTNTGTALVNHIGEFARGKKVNKYEPGWTEYIPEVPPPAYCSRDNNSWQDPSKKFRVSSLIIDNFYDNPNAVRDYALSLDFNVKGNWPGSRTVPYLPHSVKQKIQEIIFPFAGAVTNWEESSGLTGSFQITYSQDRSWIHHDGHNTWAAVCYLTPNAPVTGGTGLFRHKKTNSQIYNIADNPDTFDYYDKTTWDLVDVIGNVYNRLVIYRGQLYHMSLDYFGTNKNNARLFQVFFFSTEK